MTQVSKVVLDPGTPPKPNFSFLTPWWNLPESQAQVWKRGTDTEEKILCLTSESMYFTEQPCNKSALPFISCMFITMNNES